MTSPEISRPAAAAIPAGIPAVPEPVPESPADAGEPERLRLLAVLAGIAGPVLLAGYFGIPALIGWPPASASAATVTAFANAHQVLFFTGGWLQATGALLSIVFF